MMISDVYKPMERFGYFLAGIGVLGFIVLFTRIRDVEFAISVLILVSVVSFYHILLGAGLILIKRCLFGLFKGYLRLLYIGFPLGTYLSKQTLKYIDENNIEVYLRSYTTNQDRRRVAPATGCRCAKQERYKGNR